MSRPPFSLNSDLLTIFLEYFARSKQHAKQLLRKFKNGPGRALSDLSRHGKFACLPVHHLLECGLTIALLEWIIANDDKGRVGMHNIDGELCFLAYQGHSNDGIPEDLFVFVPAPPELYHVTMGKFLASIRENGLLSFGRDVHMSLLQSHLRHGAEYNVLVIIRYPPGTLVKRSMNGVYLAESVPPEYLSFHWFVDTLADPIGPEITF